MNTACDSMLHASESKLSHPLATHLHTSNSSGGGQRDRWQERTLHHQTRGPA